MTRIPKQFEFWVSESITDAGNYDLWLVVSANSHNHAATAHADRVVVARATRQALPVVEGEEWVVASPMPGSTQEWLRIECTELMALPRRMLIGHVVALDPTFHGVISDHLKEVLRLDAGTPSGAVPEQGTVRYGDWRTADQKLFTKPMLIVSSDDLHYATDHERAIVCRVTSQPWQEGDLRNHVLKPGSTVVVQDIRTVLYGWLNNGAPANLGGVISADQMSGVNGKVLALLGI